MKRVALTLIAALAFWVGVGLIVDAALPTTALAHNHLAQAASLGDNGTVSVETNTRGDEGDLDPPGPLSLVDSGDDDDFGGEVNDTDGPGKALGEFFFELACIWRSQGLPF